MKFQLKALAVALALVATVPAQAATDSAVSGNSSLILAVYDRTANISAMFDLGKSYSDFSIAGASFANSGIDNPGTLLTWNLATGDYATAWSTYFAKATLANSVFAVTAQDNTGNGAGNRGIISTYNSFATNPFSSQLGTISTNFDSYQLGNGLASNVTYENHSVVANGASVSSAGTSYAPNYFLSDKNFGLGPIAAGAVGSDLGVAQYISNTTGARVSPLVFANQAKFNLASNGALIYQAVPEADTWAMMLLGLGFMGFVARRKQA